MVKKVVKTTVTTIREGNSKKTKKTKTKHTSKKVGKKSSKKSVRKKARKPARKKTSRSSKKETDYAKKIYEGLEKRDSLLIENFVGLQKAMATLSVRFSELSQNMSNLLMIFEEAAKVLAESEKQVDKTLTTKLDALIEQNKNLSREITMVDSKMRRGPVKSPAPAPSLYSRQINAPQPSGSTGAIPPKQLPQP